METIPNEIIGLIFSYLQPRTLGLLTSCSKQFDKLVKSDTVLQYHKRALYKRWHFLHNIESYRNVSSIYERIQLRIKNQNRWKSQSQPFGYVLPVGEDRISKIKCRKNRLLVLSVSASKATTISVYDLETLRLLGTTETNLFRGNTAKILWKGNDWILFSHQQQFYSWNIHQPAVEQVELPTEGPLMVKFSNFVFYDGNETLFYIKTQVGNFDRYIYNVRTKKEQRINWIQCKDVYLWINFNIRTVIYQKNDGKYYMEKFTADWKRSSSIALEVSDCYGTVDFKITEDYIFLFYSDSFALARVFSLNGAIILRVPLNVQSDLSRLRYSKDGILIHELKRISSVVGVYSLKNNRFEQIKWVALPYCGTTVYKMITTDLALIRCHKSIAFKTSTTKNEIVSGAKLTPQISKLVPKEYTTWRVMDSVVSETQIILHMQSENKQNTVVVLDYCNSVVQN